MSPLAREVSFLRTHPGLRRHMLQSHYVPPPAGAPGSTHVTLARGAVCDTAPSSATSSTAISARKTSSGAAAHRALDA